MKKNNIVALINLDNPEPNLIQNSINVARSMNAELTFFYVKRGAEVVQNENHISAIQTLTDSHMETDGKMRELLASYQQFTDVELRSQIAIGNVKTQIEKHLQKTGPDLVILGKRSKKVLPWDGDRLSQFVVKKFQGMVLIAATDEVLELNEQLSVGMLSNLQTDASKGFITDLLKTTTQPLKSFRIANRTSDDHPSNPNPIKSVEYVFDSGDNAVKNLSTYVLRNKVNLLCADRDQFTQRSRKAAATNMNEIIHELPSSLLLL
jgi:hypothetical protein